LQFSAVLIWTANIVGI